MKFVAALPLILTIACAPNNESAFDSGTDNGRDASRADRIVQDQTTLDGSVDDVLGDAAADSIFCDCPPTPGASATECIDGKCVVTTCMSGYTLEAGACIDLDECANPNTCSADATCTNQAGGFVCACNAGFTGDGVTCNPVALGEGWIQRSTDTLQGLSGICMAYDSYRQRAVLFGGLRNGYTKNETWEWDGVSWTQMMPVASAGRRRDCAMAYDAARREIVVFSGNDAVGSRYDAGDTWVYDGLTWTRRITAHAPGGRGWTGMAYDLRRQRTVLYGGQNDQILGDTWEWDGNDWTRASPTASPPVLARYALAWDTVSERVVLYGGAPFNYQGARSEAFAWDGVTWSPFPAQAGVRVSGHLVFDSRRSGLILIDGPGTRNPRTWILQGSTWSPMRLQSEAPPAYGAVYDEARHEVVVFSASGTWVLPSSS